MKRLAVLLQRILPPVWCGMVLAIAVEAPLKFKAPGITRELGLGIGKLVFSALNSAELALAAAVLVPPAHSCCLLRSGVRVLPKSVTLQPTKSKIIARH